MASLSNVADMIREAERHADDGSAERIKATEYYNGVMEDLKPNKGRSSAVSRDLRSQIKKVLPSVMRTIFGNDEVVEFQPMNEGDEEAAQQASDYVNYVVFPEAGGRKAIYDAVHDALLLRNGIIKWWHDERKTAKFSSHSGLTEMELAQLVSDEGSEVVEQDERTETVMTEQGPIEVPVFDVKIRRVTTERKICVAAVPRERFLIHPDATSMTDSLLTGERMELRRSDLIAMGYDRDLVLGLPQSDDDDQEGDSNKGDSAPTDSDEADPANEPIDYYEVYVRTDQDGDGIAELRKMCFAGALGERNLLVNEEVDEIQFADLTAMFLPHQWEGASLADDLMDIQRVKSALLRQTLDNIYWQNNQQAYVNPSAVENLDDVMEPQFGKAVLLRPGANAKDAVQFAPVPFVAAQAFSMLEYFDQEASDRTGVSDASAGLAPDALQNMTAKASAMIEQGGIGQTEMMVRNLAEGLKAFYKGLLRLVIRHQDKPRTIRLRDKWVEVDPRAWDAGMDAVVNVGLGAGTRERDMQVMQFVMNLQEKLLVSLGPDNPYVKPDQVYNALAKTVEAAGLKTPSLFFTEPDEQEVAAKLKAASEKPNPEMQKLQAEMQLKQADMQMKMQFEQAKMQTSQAKEKAQMDADLQVKQAEIAAETARQRDRLAADAALAQQNIAWEREKFEREQQMQREKMEMDRQDAIWQAQAAAMQRESDAKASKDEAA